MSSLGQFQNPATPFIYVDWMRKANKVSMCKKFIDCQDMIIRLMTNITLHKVYFNWSVLV